MLEWILTLLIKLVKVSCNAFRSDAALLCASTKLSIKVSQVSLVLHITQVTLSLSRTQSCTQTSQTLCCTKLLGLLLSLLSCLAILGGRLSTSHSLTLVKLTGRLLGLLGRHTILSHQLSRCHTLLSTKLFRLLRSLLGLHIARLVLVVLVHCIVVCSVISLTSNVGQVSTKIALVLSSQNSLTSTTKRTSFGHCCVVLSCCNVRLTAGFSQLRIKRLLQVRVHVLLGLIITKYTRSEVGVLISRWRLILIGKVSCR